MAGTSFAGESGTVNVVVVVVPDDGAGDDGADGESEHPTARTLKQTMSAEIRYMLTFLQDSLRRISGRG
jgi:hypothetical protein